MPPDLPGLYYDPDKNRYFPTTSRPTGPPVRQALEHAPSALPAPRVVPPPLKNGHVRQPIFNIRVALGNARTTYSSVSRMHHLHDVECAHLAKNHRFEGRQTISGANVTAFFSSRADDRPRYVVGDADGWIYTHHVPENDPDEERSHRAMWVAQITLQSKVTSVCMSNDVTIATSLGPSSKILIRNNRSPQSMFVLHPPEKSVHDIWTASVEDRTVILGASKKAVLMRDLEAGRFESLPTHSDVFAVCQHQGLAYAGSRNGKVTRFDLRAWPSSGQTLFADAPHVSQAVTWLHTLREFELLVARINGSLAIYDLRFPQKAPVRSFAGRSSTYSTHLPVAVDPYHRFIFAAGEDRRVQAWSVATGQLLPACPSVQWDEPGPFGQVFEEPIEAMHVEYDGSRLRLRLAVGREILQYGL